MRMGFEEWREAQPRVQRQGKQLGRSLGETRKGQGTRNARPRVQDLGGAGKQAYLAEAQVLQVDVIVDLEVLSAAGGETAQNAIQLHRDARAKGIGDGMAAKESRGFRNARGEQPAGGDGALSGVEGRREIAPARQRRGG
ncbi:MAG: hypothetical protein K2X35_05040 [Bryobacteraceae bacterium]|nr:hypothetical protein [Bryobacteraceae bacterium]